MISINCKPRHQNKIEYFFLFFITYLNKETFYNSWMPYFMWNSVFSSLFFHLIASSTQCYHYFTLLRIHISTRFLFALQFFYAFMCVCFVTRVVFIRTFSQIIMVHTHTYKTHWKHLRLIYLLFIFFFDSLKWARGCDFFALLRIFAHKSIDVLGNYFFNFMYSFRFCSADAFNE